MNLLVKPLMDYKLLGTSIQLDKESTYRVSLATNQPNWEEREAIFCNEVLLEKGEYTVIGENTFQEVVESEGL